MFATALRNVRLGECFRSGDIGCGAHSQSRTIVIAALALCLRILRIQRIQRMRALPLQAMQRHSVTAIRPPHSLKSIRSAAVCIGRCIAWGRLRTLRCLCIKRSATLRSIHRGWTPRQPLAASRYLIKIGEPDGQRWG